MYYELYLDVLFFTNFIMDYVLLVLVKKMLKCSATQVRLILGAISGAGFTCIVLLLPIPYPFLKLALFHLVVNTAMLRIGLKIRGIRCFLKAYILLYISSLLLGGVLYVWNPKMRVGGLFFAIVILGYGMVSKIWDFIGSVHRMRQYTCEVELYLGEKVCRVRGIIDTGNGLTAPLTNEPVHVLDIAVAKEFLGNVNLSQIRYIPYRTIAKKEGVLLALHIERMRVHHEEELWINHPLIGISEEPVSSGEEYQMILNPNIF